MRTSSLGWPMPLLAPASSGDGTAARTDAPSPRRKARMFVDGVTGVRFEHLVLFAEPLFTDFGLDSDAAFALPDDLDSADEPTLAALEAARLLWAYFSLPSSDRRSRFADLASFLLGPDHTPEDEIDLEMVIDRMEAQWDVLSDQERAAAEATGAPTLDFDAVLAHPLLAHDSEPEPEHSRTYGPDKLSALEAQALFAQPLMNATDDPDEMEAMLERAHSYWELAHRPAAQRQRHLQDLLDALATTPRQRQQIEHEAGQMLDRFDSLFPEHRS